MLQAWLAVKGPLLKSAATQDSLWSRALGAVGSNAPTPSESVASPVLSPRRHRGSDSITSPVTSPVTSPPRHRKSDSRHRVSEVERQQAVSADVARSYCVKSDKVRSRPISDAAWLGFYMTMMSVRWSAAVEVVHSWAKAAHCFHGNGGRSIRLPRRLTGGKLYLNDWLIACRCWSTRAWGLRRVR